MTEKPSYIYFASDFHLGLPFCNPAQRERRVADFLTEVKDSAHTIFLLGDIFDFWWEYRMAVPRGFIRFLGKLAELSDAGVRICYFTGNHDVWIKDYLHKECGVEIIRGSHIEVINGKRFYLAHGDCIGERSMGKHLLEWVFNNRVLQCLYSMLHPRWGLGLGHFWSKHSRLAKGVSIPWKGTQESLYKFAVNETQHNPVDYFVFGHRHTPVQELLPSGAQLCILSDWIQGSTYALFDGSTLKLKEFHSK